MIICFVLRPLTHHTPELKNLFEKDRELHLTDRLTKVPSLICCHPGVTKFNTLGTAKWTYCYYLVLSKLILTK